LTGFHYLELAEGKTVKSTFAIAFSRRNRRLTQVRKSQLREKDSPQRRREKLRRGPQRVGGEWKKELVEKSGFPERRVVIVHAAPRDSKSGLIEVWVVPQGAPLPDPYKPEPGEIDEDPQDVPG
jgi:hypothetical protein